jgi:antirestriction protein ArdC
MNTSNNQSENKNKTSALCGTGEAHQPDVKKDLMQEVTNSIIEALETGAAPWVKPWQGDAGVANGSNVPKNLSTGASYRGVNTLILWIAAFSKGYTSGYWLTFKQAKALGGQIKKGEKATSIAYYSTFELKDKNNEQGEAKKVPFLKSYAVFAAEQCEGLTLPAATVFEPIETRFANADEVLAQAEIVFGGDRACFVPSIDKINMPVQAAFKSAENFYATALHELTHWTGHASRLSRDFSGRYGSQAYAREELVAELGAAYLCAALGIQGQLQHAEYIASWLEVLKSDKKAIFQAASAAQKAVDLVLKQEQQEEKLAA